MMKKKIIFLAPFPNPKNIKEGMMQRVDAVDKMFDNNEYDKTYIVPRFKTFKTEFSVIDKNIVEIKLSIWRSFFFLLKKLKDADVVYSHSLYGISLAGLLFLPLVKIKNLALDVHGIIPEEIRLAGHGKLKQLIYSKLESITIKKASKLIVVTNAMKKHLLEKYNNLISAKILVYPILPNTIRIQNGFYEEDEERINFIYSGNMQSYQNIPLMIKSIKKMIDVPNVYFYILTGQKQEMIKLFRINGLEERNNIFIKTVDPTELDQYYKKSHYGFILRDDIDVNNVACPTKIIEYLAYGITCITLNNKIGDFEKLGFEYINIEQLEECNLKAHKSFKNHQIYNYLYSENKPSKLISFVSKL